LEETSLGGAVLELGCATGWRLARIRDMFQEGVGPHGQMCVKKPIQTEKARYNDLKLRYRRFTQIHLRFLVGVFYRTFSRNGPIITPGQEVLTYKLYCANISKSLGTHSGIFKVVFDHDRPNQYLGDNPSDERGYCYLPQESPDGYCLKE